MSNKPILQTPPDDFRRKLCQPGGMDKASAVGAAGRAVEALRQKMCAELTGQIGKLQHDGARLAPEEAAEIRRAAASVFNLAGTYGYPLLQGVAANLLDALDAMRERSVSCGAPVAVHGRAARLFAPDAQAPEAKGGQAVLTQLRGVVEHLQLQQPCSAENCRACPARMR